MTDEKKLFSYLEKYIKNKFDEQQSVEGIKFIDLKHLGIKNFYGIEISECSLFFENTFRPFMSPYVFKVTYNITDCLPKNPNLKLFCTVEGKTLSSALEKFIDHIASKVYCRDCGKLCIDKEYSVEEEQCMSCILETILLSRKADRIFCSICQQETHRHIVLDCGHMFHRKCVSKLLRNSCPLCSKSIFVSSS